jgi:hypothetical protein
MSKHIQKKKGELLAKKKKEGGRRKGVFIFVQR